MVISLVKREVSKTTENSHETGTSMENIYCMQISLYGDFQFQNVPLDFGFPVPPVDQIKMGEPLERLIGIGSQQNSTFLNLIHGTENPKHNRILRQLVVIIQRFSQ